MSNFEIKSIESLTFYDKETGEKILTSTGGIPILESITSELTEPTEQTSKPNFIGVGRNSVFTATLDALSQESLTELTGEFLPINELTIKRYIIKQNKTHKKKRINKKWFKKYGVTIYVYL